MTEADARRIVAYLNAGFPREALDKESFAVYASEVALLRDAAAGIEAAQACVRSGDAFPSIKEFRQLYRMKAESARQSVPAIEASRATGIPEWVQVWWWARRIRIPHDERSFPQQHEFVDPLTIMGADDQDALHAEWVEAGRPRVTQEQIADLMLAIVK